MGKKKEGKAEGAEQLVTVIELEDAPNGTKRLGNSVEVPKGEAIEGIRADRYKAISLSRGVVPSDWEGGAKAVTADAAEVDGYGSTGDEREFDSAD